MVRGYCAIYNNIINPTDPQLSLNDMGKLGTTNIVMLIPVDNVRSPEEVRTVVLKVWHSASTVISHSKYVDFQAA